MSLILLIFCLLNLANVGFDMSLELKLVECRLDGPTPRIPIGDGVWCIFDGVFA